MHAVSLFAGGGGCSLGLKQAGFDIRLAADIDADACETYAANLGSAGVWQVDLSTISGTDLLDRVGLGRRSIDLIVGGPPCQGFSSAGARDWADPRNRLLRSFVEIVVSVKPTWFIMENVEGLLTANDGFYIIEALDHFLEAGYWVKAKKVYMEEYGLPQRRKRVVVVGNLEQQAFEFPSGMYYEQPQLPLFPQHPQRSILDAISDLPAPSESGIVFYDHPTQNAFQAALRLTNPGPLLHHQVRQVSSLIQQRIALLAEGETMKDLPRNLQHPSFTRRAFRRVMDGTPTAKRGGAPSGLKRLVATAPSLTITSAAPTEFIHPQDDRLLTLRECARIQSFPDWYQFRGSGTSIARQIGNAIPPLFLRLLAEHISGNASWAPQPDSPGRWLGMEATKAEGMSPALSRMLAALERRTYAYTG
jgi:DNA (cytosine-5)-methyltransferase 1